MADINYKPLERFRYGLLGKATTVVTASETGQTGSVVYPVADSRLTVQNLLQDTTGAELKSTIYSSPNGNEYFEYTPFVVKVSKTVSTFAHKLEDANKMLSDQLDITLQTAIEHELWTGELSTGLLSSQATTTNGTNIVNRYLGSTDYLVSTASQAYSGASLDAIELKMSQETIGYQPTYHLPRGYYSKLPLWSIEDREKDGFLTTTSGSPVVLGSGYHKDTTPALGGFYATGPLTVVLGNVDVYPEEDMYAVNVSNNTITYSAEIPVAVVWITEKTFFQPLTADGS